MNLQSRRLIIHMSLTSDINLPPHLGTFPRSFQVSTGTTRKKKRNDVLHY
jgi:hypothetical protein